MQKEKDGSFTEKLRMTNREKIKSREEWILREKAQDDKGQVTSPITVMTEDRSPE